MSGGAIMPAVEYVKTAWALTYTGANGAEMSAFVGGTPIVSEIGGVLSLGDPVSGEVTMVFQTGDVWDKNDGSLWHGADFNPNHVTKAAVLQDNDTIFNPATLNAQVAALQASDTAQNTNISNNTAAIAALQGKLGKADIVSISVPILLLGGTADRPIVWNRAFSNASYDLSYAFDASTIGRITCSVVAGTKTTTGVTIRITAGLAVSVLGVVHVFGIGV